MQNRRKRFCYVGDLAEEVVRSEVQKNHHAYRGKEYKRNEPAVEKYKHRNRCAQNRKSDVDGLFLFAEVFQVRYKRRHTGNKALFARYGTYFSYSVHCHVFGRRAVKEYGNHGCVVGVEFIVYFIGNQFFRNRNVRQSRIPYNGIDVIDFFYLVTKCRNVFVFHIFNDDERERAFAEVFFQFVLSDYRIHIGGKIVEHIIVYSRSYHSEHRRHHKQNGDYQNWYAVFYDRS